MKIACVDIGGTYIKSGLLEHGVLTQVRETPTNAQAGGPALLQTVAQLVRGMAGAERVGVSTAGEVNVDTGEIRLCDNIPGYTGLNVRALLTQALHLPVAVENDVNAAAVGELHYGAGVGKHDFLMVSYGTGVGGAIVIEDALYRGSAYSAGEFGGILTHPEAIDPAQRGSGSYERYASTAALVAKAMQYDAALDSGRKIFAQLQTPAVRALVDAWIGEIAVGLVTLVHTFNPHTFVLGGGIMREEYILHTLRAVMCPMLKSSFRAFALVSAALGNHAGMMGAGALAAQLDVR